MSCAEKSPSDPPTRGNVEISYEVLFNKTFDPIAVYRVDEDPYTLSSTDSVRFVDINPSYEKVMKVRRDDVIGCSFSEVWPRSEPRWAQIIIDCLRYGHTVHTEGRSFDTDSYLEAIAFPIPPRMAAVIFLDKTRLKGTNEALLRKQSELRALATQLTLIEETTRRAIATDLHDHIGYELVSQLRKIRALKEAVPQELRADVEALEHSTEELISSSRSLIFELSPPILKEVGLNPALRSLAEKLLNPQGIKWDLRERGTIKDFYADDGTCILLYRMTRELIVNVIKHAQATHVTIIINRGPGRIMVAVEDNGRGFPAKFDMAGDERRAAKSFGLFSIKARLDPIGGELKIISEPGHGATVAMICPLTLKEGEFK